MSQSAKLSERYVLADWPAPANVRAFITTRKGGISTGNYDSLNLSFRSGDQPEHVEVNRQRVVDDWSWTDAPCWLHQVHGTTVVDAAKPYPEPEADASVARQINVPAVVMVADCVPVLFCNDRGNCVAAAHAGWKGLASGILENTIAMMKCSPSELMAWIGPAISQPFFEVGPEVREVFTANQPDAERGFMPGEGDRQMGDLSFLARQRLNRSGVTRIYGGDTCVYSQEDLFFSYRRDGKESGRMAAAVWMTEN